VINPSLPEILLKIKAASVPTDMITRMVGVDGCGGSGKSTLAAQLAQSLDAVVIHTDDFASWSNALNWHPRFMTQVIDPLRQNKPAHYQRYDWHTRALAEWHQVQPGGTIIIEGVSATRALVRPALSYCIFVDTPINVRLARGLARDGEQARGLWETWQAEEEGYLTAEQPQRHADMMIDGTCPVV
jgi:uridine kinase